MAAPSELGLSRDEVIRRPLPSGVDVIAHPGEIDLSGRGMPAQGIERRLSEQARQWTADVEAHRAR